MKISAIQILLYAISLFIFTGALDDDYDDDFSVDTLNDTNAKESYPALSARLNCSNLVINHKGVRIEETLSDSIYKPTPVPTTVAVPFEDDGFTLSDELYFVTPEAYENFTERPQVSDYQDYTVQINFADNSVLYDYINFQPLSTESTEEVSSTIAEPTSAVPLHNLPTDDKNKFGARPESANTSKFETNFTLADCFFTFTDSGEKYNWFQIISQSGGIPGEVNATRLTPNVTKVFEPCHRPVNNTSSASQDLLYKYELIEFKKFYRRERAFLRFAGSPSEFVDIVGQLVWAPPGFHRQFYRLSYHKDDTGFYVNIRKRQKCEFKKDPLSVDCYLVENFHPCEFDLTRNLSPGLRASLIG